VLIFLNIWQVFRYREYKSQVEDLVTLQEEWLEKNKRMISAITVYSSPGRISQIAENQLVLQRADSDDVILIEIGPGGGRGE
jgi:hypothetical protein